MVLAAGSALAGWVGVPKLLGENGLFQAFEHWLAPVFEPAQAAAHAAGHVEAHASHTTEALLMLLSVGLAITGILVARYIYLKLKESQRPTGGALYPVLYNKWYIDEIYNFLFVNGLAKGGGTVLSAFDRNVVDGGVNGAAWLTRITSRISMWYDTWIVDGLVNLTAFFVRAFSFPVRFVQTGWVQSYAFVFVLGVFGAVALYWWGR
jgi:NADH-quinone oxidoreductase subunit L